MTGSFVGRGNQYIQLVKVLCCKLPTIEKSNYQLSHIRSEPVPSVVGGECITTSPLWPSTSVVQTKCSNPDKMFLKVPYYSSSIHKSKVHLSLLI